jgi:hypothetical protein
MKRKMVSIVLSSILLLAISGSATILAQGCQYQTVTGQPYCSSCTGGKKTCVKKRTLHTNCSITTSTSCGSCGQVCAI